MDRATRSSDQIERLLARYDPLPGAADELFAETGAMRPVWQPLAAALAAMPEDERAARFARGSQYLRDAGVFYRQYGEDGAGEIES